MRNGSRRKGGSVQCNVRVEDVAGNRESNNKDGEMYRSVLAGDENKDSVS